VVTDEQICRAEAAKKYWKTHDFDPINCIYYSGDKETDFLENRTAEA